MPQRTWTTTELKEASILWKQGNSITKIAEVLGRGRESIKHVTSAHRDLFPRRRSKKLDYKELVEIKLPIPIYTYSLMKAEAKSRGISINMLIRETFLHRFVRKTWKPPANT
jgi:transposase